MNEQYINDWIIFLDEIKNDENYNENYFYINKLCNCILQDLTNSYDEKIKLAKLLNLNNKINIYFTIINSNNALNLIKGEASYYLADTYCDTSNDKATFYYDLSYSYGFIEQSKYNGSIHLIFGPMFSGKTTELMRQLTRKKIANQDNILIKYSGDTRFNDINIVTHDKLVFESTRVSKGNSLKETVSDLLNICAINTNIFIDEIQFFIDGAEICDMLANNGFNVYVCGLQGDYNRHIFPTIAKIIPLCDSITHLTSIDKKSGKECTNTKRICESNKLELIGGDESYEAVDRFNYFTN
jgi:thymidine kinase